LILGVKESTLLNKIFTAINVLIMAFIIVVGATQVNPANWRIDTANLTWTDIHGQNHSCPESARCGAGGFFPYGLQGVIDGAAKCFYAFVGFDVIASTGEEVVNPKRNIPLAICLTLITVAILYCGLSAVLTLMIPYYYLDADTALAHAFEYVGLDWAKYIVTTGAAISLATW
jgi:amino acid transporter